MLRYDCAITKPHTCCWMTPGYVTPCSKLSQSFSQSLLLLCIGLFNMEDCQAKDRQPNKHAKRQNDMTLTNPIRKLRAIKPCMLLFELGHFVMFAWQTNKQMMSLALTALCKEQCLWLLGDPSCLVQARANSMLCDNKCQAKERVGGSLVIQLRAAIAVVEAVSGCVTPG